jgi:hypothetical protein
MKSIHFEPKDYHLLSKLNNLNLSLQINGSEFKMSLEQLFLISHSSFKHFLHTHEPFQIHFNVSSLLQFFHSLISLLTTQTQIEISRHNSTQYLHLSQIIQNSSLTSICRKSENFYGSLFYSFGWSYFSSSFVKYFTQLSCFQIVIRDHHFT